jgi:hypothetical protein
MVENTFKSEYKATYEGRDVLNIDVAPPTLNFVYSGPKYFSRDTMFITSANLIKLKAADSGAGVKEIDYKLDEASDVVFNDSIPITVGKEGTHDINYYGIDEVNNKKTGDFFFIVDNTGPVLEHVFSSSPIGEISLFKKNSLMKVYPKGSIIFLTGTDALAGLKDIYYQIDEQKETEYGTPIKLTIKGTRVLRIRGTDQLGNETVVKEIEFFIK